MKPLTSALLALSLVACAADPDGGSPPVREIVHPPTDYEGPRVVASMVGTELDVRVHVPTGGHALGVQSSAREGDHTVVRLSLTEPGAGELVTEALAVVQTRVALPAEPGSILVRVQRVQRGVQYFVEPEFRLAAIVTR